MSLRLCSRAPETVIWSCGDISPPIVGTRTVVRLRPGSARRSPSDLRAADPQHRASCRWSACASRRAGVGGYRPRAGSRGVADPGAPRWQRPRGRRLADPGPTGHGAQPGPRRRLARQPLQRPAPGRGTPERRRAGAAVRRAIRAGQARRSERRPRPASTPGARRLEPGSARGVRLQRGATAGRSPMSIRNAPRPAACRRAPSGAAAVRVRLGGDPERSRAARGRRSVRSRGGDLGPGSTGRPGSGARTGVAGRSPEAARRGTLARARDRRRTHVARRTGARPDDAGATASAHGHRLGDTPSGARSQEPRVVRQARPPRERPAAGLAAARAAGGGAAHARRRSARARRSATPARAPPAPRGRSADRLRSEAPRASTSEAAASARERVAGRRRRRSVVRSARRRRARSGCTARRAARSRGSRIRLGDLGVRPTAKRRAGADDRTTSAERRSESRV